MSAPAAGPVSPTIDPAVAAVALRVAVAKMRLENAERDYKSLQGDDVFPVFADVRRSGIPTLEVRLPDGTLVCKIPIEKGADVTTWDEAELLGVIATNDPAAFEPYAEPSALKDPGVLAMLAEHFPDRVKYRVRPEVDARYRAEAAENGGRVFLRAGSTPGEQVTVATTEHRPASGRYSVRWEKKGMDRLGDAIDAGAISQWGDVIAPFEAPAVIPAPFEVTRADLDAKPPPGELQAPPDPAFGAPSDALFFDADGYFKSPEMAAMHAVHVQGGFSTPARECRRMLADHERRGTLDSPNAAMCRQWLARRNLDVEGDDEPAGAS